jgi:formylglycine-generating enzyme required for sulfatase activity
MVRIPSTGATTTYIMGCPASDGWCPDFSTPAHQVTLDAYLIDRYPVTAAEYKLCVDAGVCTYIPIVNPRATYDAVGMENHPINFVNWDQATAYCAWLGKRLPTEAEWERAAKGPTHQRYPWGNACPTTWSGTYCADAEWTPSTAKANGWEDYTHDDFYATSPVDAFASGASPEGVQDLVGNVWEWGSDWPQLSYPEDPVINPTGASTGSRRVLRGASYSEDGEFLRSTHRGGRPPSDRESFIGFRCVRTAP